MKYDALLLDADDTVFDFRAGETRAILSAFSQAGIPEDAIPDYHRINEALWRELEQGTMTQERLRYERLARLAELYPMRMPPREAADLLVEELSRQSIYFDGAKEAVEEIARVIPVAIVTNGIARIQRSRLHLSGLDGIVKCAVISEETGCAKPDPRVFECALQKLRVTKERAVMAGDSLRSDIRGANAAGIDAVWVNPAGLPVPAGYRVAQVISSIRELPGAVLD